MEKYLLILSILTFFNTAIAKVCSFEYGVYNVQSRTSAKRIKISIPKKQIKKEFTDERGCTLCQEDQVMVYLKNGIKFKACPLLAADLETLLNQVIDKGFKINEVIGYRPQMSRGDLDSKGNRTEFSNHSFGSAIDVNPRSNGLYDNCVHWSSNCRLRKGGAWRPKHNKASIKKGSFLIKAMSSLGLKWGGELQGKQKDFMHFSYHGN